MPGPTIWTIGHSTRSSDEFVTLLHQHDLTGVADVRTMPRSRRHPHFSREALHERLSAEKVEYRHFPVLGGLRKPNADSPNGAWKSASFRGYADHMQTGAFGDALDDLLAFAATRSVAVMCAEALWWQCHRMLVSDALVAREVDVRHVMGQAGRSTLQPHRMTPFARVDAATSRRPRLWYPGLV